MKFIVVVGVILALLTSLFGLGIGASDGDNRYNVQFDGNWTSAEKSIVLRGVRDVGSALARETLAHDSPDEAFQSVYRLSADQPMIFYKPASSGLVGGEVRDFRHITFYGFYSWSHSDRTQKSTRLVVHELGHAFEDVLREMVGEKLPRKVLLLAQSMDRSFPDRVSYVGNNWAENSSWGYAGLRYEWQQSADISPAEEFADMFLGWTYSAWGNDDAGRLRRDFMKVHMSSWVHMACENYQSR